MIIETIVRIIKKGRILTKTGLKWNIKTDSTNFVLKVGSQKHKLDDGKG